MMPMMSLTERQIDVSLYLSLLTLPIAQRAQLHIQQELSRLRDQIADDLGADPEDVQIACEQMVQRAEAQS